MTENEIKLSAIANNLSPRTALLAVLRLTVPDTTRDPFRCPKLCLSLPPFFSDLVIPASSSRMSRFAAATGGGAGRDDGFSGDEEDEEERLRRIEKMQSLLDLLLQIRPSADGMIVALVLEAMDCAIIEILEVYRGICNGIAAFLVGLDMGGGHDSIDDGAEERRRKMGAMGVRVLRKAAEQSEQLSAYFDLCRRLGVINAAELSPVERIPDEDIVRLEKLVMGYVKPAGAEPEVEIEGEEEGSAGDRRPGTLVTEDWELFEEEGMEEKGKCRNPFELPKTWASLVHRSNVLSDFSENLLD